jgi:Peptidase family M13
LTQTIMTMKLQLRQKPFIKVAWIYVSQEKNLFLLSCTKVHGNSIFSLSASPFLHLAVTYAEQIRKIGDQPLRDILKTLGGWPVIEPNWKPPNRSIENLMGTLRGEYSEPVLIELYVGADDKNSSINILQVRAKMEIQETGLRFTQWKRHLACSHFLFFLLL